MSSSDVRDVLNISDASGGGASASSRPSKKQKLSVPRPNLKGLAREVHNLGGDNPIAIVPEVTQFKRRRLASRKPAARWELRVFHNSARDDKSLLLRHWRRIDEKEAAATAQQQQQQQKDAEQPQGQEQVPPPSGEAETQNPDPKMEEQQAQADVGQEDGQTAKQDEQASDSAQAPAHQSDNIEDSAFAKYNAQVSVPQYTDEQYQQHLKSEDWSREETDYLMELVRDFDIRWPLIWDRYEWTPQATNGVADADGDESKAIVPAAQARSMEDLKTRFYEVAAKTMAAQRPVQFMSQAEFSLHEVMTHFDARQEKLRKEFAINSLSRSREEAREEESLLIEIKRILARSERFNEERHELYNRLDYPHAETDISNFKSSAGLQTLLQNLMTVDKSKKRKSLLGPEGVSPSNPAVTATTAAQTPAQEAGRRDSTATNANSREPAAAATPTSANRKGQQQQQQPAERPKLTEKEEALYGVTHHDRLGSGPTFRTEKINKLFSHKSNQQQLRINNTLNELDVPAKLAMPTAATTSAYEQLLGAVNSLLDARKVSDKLEAEIKLEMAKKAEREKANAPTESEQAEKKSESADSKEGKDEAAGAASKAAADALAVDKEDDEPKQAPDGRDEEGGEENSKEENGNADENNDESRAPASEDNEDEEEPTETVNDDVDEDQKEKSARPGSSGASHKRSASVLSVVSDKSAKRQKK
jgi:DNA methyltransferase 1-associated protein 1